MVQRRVYVDSNLLILLFESGVLGTETAERLFTQARDLTVVTSELTIGEVLVGPMRTGDRELEAMYRDLLENGDLLEVVPVARDILYEAARLRSVSSMRLPDAVHVATAVSAACEAVVSSDKRLYVPEGMVRINPAATPLDDWLQQV